MIFTYRTMSDEEITKEEQENSLFPAGTYGFEVLEFVKFGETSFFTKDTQSKSGNPMMQIALRVFNDEGDSITILDYLLDAMPRKLKNSAYACGLGAEYEDHTLCAEKYIGKQGNLNLVIQKGKKKNDGSGDFYPDRNSVKDYVLTDQATPTPPAHETAELEDDSIPF